MNSTSQASWRDRFPPLVILAGLGIGAAGVLLTGLGNPPNMGICTACFERDIAGALGLHRAALVQYLRPEILGIVLGAFALAWIRRESAARSGSAPALRFALGGVVMIGALVFLGCSLRLLLRVGGGDANALVGLGGFVAGVAAGSLFLRRGTDLGRSRPESHATSRWVMPVLAAGLLALAVAAPPVLLASTTGPGSLHAPLGIALAIGLGIGALAQASRLCFVGAIRDLILFRSPHLTVGVLAVLIAALVGNLLLGRFSFGFAGQPIAHAEHLWNFLAMALVGLGSTLLGGCPLRQLVLAAQGNGDAVVTVAGMVAGAAIAHNFGLAASPAGVPVAGMVAVGLGLAVCLVVAVVMRERA
jgi:YedE family putative selenium metabolism protein